MLYVPTSGRLIVFDVRAVNFGEMTTKQGVMYSYRDCCQIALMARPASLRLAEKLAIMRADKI